MTPRRTICFAALALLLVGSGAIPMENEVEVESFTVEQTEQGVVITWVSKKEEGLVEYVLERSAPMSNGEFVEVEQFPSKGAGSTYRYTDTQLYKSVGEMVDYRLSAKLQDGGDPVWLKEEQVNYASTAVRRTWGSIKAMFQ